MSDVDTDTDTVTANALVDLVEAEFEALHVVLDLACTGCSWRTTRQGFVFATIAAGAHQRLHGMLSPAVPAITAAACDGGCSWTMPSWSAPQTSLPSCSGPCQNAWTRCWP